MEYLSKLIGGSKSYKMRDGYAAAARDGTTNRKAKVTAVAQGAVDNAQKVIRFKSTRKVEDKQRSFSVRKPTTCETAVGVGLLALYALVMALRFGLRL